jgi:tetratricopeptide (TPR) repeat protein
MNMADLFDSGSDPFAVLNQDTSSQRAQVAQYSILRAATYLQNNDNASALKEFKKALAFDSQNTTAQTYIGKLNLAMGNNYEAIKAFKTMVQAQPTSVDAHVNLANAYLQDKQYSESEKELKAAARLDPTNPLPDYTLGLQYSNTDRLAEAVIQFSKVQKISPNDGNVYYALGMTYNKQGRYEEAVSNLVKSLSLKKTFPDANYELGIAYTALGRKEEAQKQLSILQSSGAAQAQELQFTLETPQMVYMDQNNNKNFNQLLGPATPLWMLDPSLLMPNTKTEMSVAIQFNNEMDSASVMNPVNWDISRAQNAEGGYYISQTGGREASVPLKPTFVSYNPETRQATVTFTVQQNSATDTVNKGATLDPSHLVFKFSGVDTAGRQMDTNADEINGAVLKAF